MGVPGCVWFHTAPLLVHTCLQHMQQAALKATIEVLHDKVGLCMGEESTAQGG